MFWCFIFLAAWAVASVSGRRSLTGLVPGVWLGWVCWFSFAGTRLTPNLPIPAWLAVVIPLLLILSRFMSPGLRKWIDIPLDWRIVIALLSGFILRSLIIVVIALYWDLGRILACLMRTNL